MEEKTKRKIDDYKKILNKLKNNKEDKEANDIINEAFNKDIIKLSKIYTNLNKEETVGFILTFNSGHSDVVLNTRNGIIKTLFYSCEHGDITSEKQVDKETCDIINEIICNKIGLEYNKEHEKSHKQNNIQLEYNSLENIIEKKLDYYRDLLNKFNYEKSNEDNNKLVRKLLRSNFIKKSKIYITINGSIKEELLGYVLTLDCEYSNILFDTEYKIIETMCPCDEYKYSECLYGRHIDNSPCNAIVDFISEKYNIDKEKTIRKLF